MEWIQRAAAVGGDGGRDDQADGAGWAEDVVVRGEKQRADQPANDDRGDHRLRRQIEDERKADGLGDGDESQRRARQQIRAKFTPGIMAQFSDKGETHLEHLVAHRSHIGPESGNIVAIHA
jgi:hypothetical protein